MTPSKAPVLGSRVIQRRYVIAIVTIVTLVAGMALTASFLTQRYEAELTNISHRARLLLDVSRMLEQYETDSGEPAANLTDLAKYRATHTDAYVAIEKKDIIVIWGRRMRPSPAGQVIVAHERVDREDGVMLLFSDGSVDRVSKQRAKELVGGD